MKLNAMMRKFCFSFIAFAMILSILQGGIAPVVGAEVGNLALKKPVAFSSHQSAGRGEWVVDGDATTFWTPTVADLNDGLSAWIRVDLESVQKFDQVNLQFDETAGPHNIEKIIIEYSNDDETWQTAFESSEEIAKQESYSLSSVEARYVKLTFKMIKVVSIKLSEIELYSSSGANARVDPVQEPIQAEDPVTENQDAQMIVLQLDNLEAVVNGEKQTLDVAPTLAGNFTMVPFRFIAEALGAEVGWDNDTRTVTLTLQDTAVSLTIDSVEATVNGSKVQLDAAAVIMNDFTMVPLRFVAETLHQEVKWDGDTRTITLIPLNET